MATVTSGPLDDGALARVDRSVFDRRRACAATKAEARGRVRIIALDRSQRALVRPLAATPSARSQPDAQIDANAATPDEAMVIRVARSITPAVVSVAQSEGSGSGI